MSKDKFADKLVAKAGEVFEHFGYKKTTMDEIARQFGKGKSSIYYYFSCKEDIFQAVVEKEAVELQKQLQNAIDSSSNPMEKFRNYVVTHVEVFHKVINFQNAIKNDGLLHLDFIEKLRKKYEKSEIEMIEVILKEGTKNNKFNISDTRTAAIAMVLALKGLEENFYAKSNKEELQIQLEGLLKILFFGIVNQ